MEIPKGRGVLKAKILEAKYEVKLEFPEETGGCKTKNLPQGMYGYILELHIASKNSCTSGLQVSLYQLELLLQRLYMNVAESATVLAIGTAALDAHFMRVNLSCVQITCV